jgi:hypothetical protein
MTYREMLCEKNRKKIKIMFDGKRGKNYSLRK